MTFVGVVALCVVLVCDALLVVVVEGAGVVTVAVDVVDVVDVDAPVALVRPGGKPPEPEPEPEPEPVDELVPEPAAGVGETIAADVDVDVDAVVAVPLWDDDALEGLGVSRDMPPAKGSRDAIALIR